MDAKRVRLVLCTTVIVANLACQKKVDTPARIVEDSNSEYSGKECYGQAIEGRYIVTRADGRISVVNSTREELEQTLQRQSKDSNSIVIVEQDRQITLRGLNFQTRFDDSSKPLAEGVYWQVWGQEDMRANSLWEQGVKGSGITVAVIDAGVDRLHPSLIKAIATNPDEIPDNGIDDDNNGLVDDYAGYDFAHQEPYARPSTHGTHVSGIIAADPKESPMVGVAYQSKILPLNIMDDRGGGSLSAAVMAIDYAAQRKVRVINASWGGAVCAVTLRQMIESLNSKNILFVAAAGNDGVNIDYFPEFPAGFGLPNQLTIGATMPSGLMAAFSNYSFQRVHILAPGHQILSSVPGGWLPASGTSMAAPFVSGLAALLWSRYPEATLVQIKSAILNSVRTPQDYTPVMSKGRIDAPLALENLVKLLNQ